MLVSFAEEKTGECVVCCHRCGAFLMESASTTSYMVCPECGARLVVMHRVAHALGRPVGVNVDIPQSPIPNPQSPKIPIE